jgi:hypothetical protein
LPALPTPADRDTTVFKGPTLIQFQLSYFPLWRDGHKNQGIQKPVYIWGKLEFHILRRRSRLKKDSKELKFQLWLRDSIQKLKTTIKHTKTTRYNKSKQ